MKGSTMPKLMDYPSLETERLYLRLLTVEDADAVYLHFSDEEITRFMDIEPCKDRKEAEEIIMYHIEDSGCRWGLFEKTSNQLVGTCGYHYLRAKDGKLLGEIGFDLSRKYWGKGFMQEVLNTVIPFGFNEMKLTTIDATVDPKNERSMKLMEKLGFKRAPELQDQLVYYFLEQ